jgi:hypothetical protein
MYRQELAVQIYDCRATSRMCTLGYWQSMLFLLGPEASVAWKALLPAAAVQEIVTRLLLKENCSRYTILESACTSTTYVMPRMTWG